MSGRKRGFKDKGSRGHSSGTSSRGHFSGSRGRGGGGGGTGRNLERYFSEDKVENNRRVEKEDRPKPPPGLKGRELGLWYRDRQKKRNEDDRLFSEIKLDSEKQTNICRLLNELKINSENTQEAGPSKSLNSFLVKYNENLEANANAKNNSDLAAKMSSSKLIERIPRLDTELKSELDSKDKSRRYISMMEFRQNLPSFKSKSQILKLISENQVVVISGATGCGKTTQVPQFILDQQILENNGSLCNILCTQPRRISAIGVAERVAEERDERVGQSKSIGYSIRLENKLPSREGGTLLYCTTGVVFQYLKSDSYLRKYSHIIVDEIHERDVQSDFLLVILKDLIKVRPDLKVILMSATLNSEKFSDYFDNCPKLTIPGFTFNVTEYFLEDALQKTKYEYETKRIPYAKMNEYYEFISPYLRKLKIEKKYQQSVINQISKPESEELDTSLIVRLISVICVEDPNANGAILVFLPGWEDISNLNSELQGSGRFPPSKFIIIPLHSLMPTVNQREIFNRAPSGKRKIILATNIAETSITIDDCTHVIDGGRIKLTNFNINKNIETLDNEWVSRANAKQRRGRAGRVQEGICYHLYSKHREKTLEDYKKPEILRKRIEETILQIKLLRLGKALPFLTKLLDCPTEKSINLALERLKNLNALDDKENLTPLGFHLAQLPMDPQSGKMILFGAIFSCLDPILSVAASLAFRDPFHVPLGKERIVDEIRFNFAEDTKSDHVAIIRAIEGYERAQEKGTDRDYCYRNFLSSNTVHLLINLKKQFAQYLHELQFISSTNHKDPQLNLHSKNIGLVKALICSGLYPNIATIVLKGKVSMYSQVKTIEDGVVQIHPKSINSKEKYFENPFLVYHKKMKSKKVNLYDTSMISAFALIFFGGKLDFSRKSGIESIGVDGIYRFHCKRDTFKIFQALREELDEILANKIENPATTSWCELSKEGALLKATIELISSEYRDQINDSDSDDDY